MPEILKEKADFLKENKDVLIDNLGVIGYQLFLILDSDTKLNEMNEYSEIMKYIKNKKSNNYEIKDEISILYSLASYIDRTCADISVKEKHKNNIFRYSLFFRNQNNIINKSKTMSLFA